MSNAQIAWGGDAASRCQHCTAIRPSNSAKVERRDGLLTRAAKGLRAIGSAKKGAGMLVVGTMAPALSLLASGLGFLPRPLDGCSCSTQHGRCQLAV